MSTHSFNIGDSVKVKDGILEPGTEAFSIGGWQGRIIAVRDEEDPTVVDIKWDSVTLKNMPRHFIEECEEEGYGWDSMGLYPEDVEPAVARDTEEQTDNVREDIEDEQLHSYTYLGEQGKRIAAVLQGIEPDDEMGVIERWGDYIEEHLSFPFEAEVNEWQERGPLRAGDRVKVKNISLIDDHYGVIVAIRRGRERFDCPLADLAVLDEASPNAQLVQDYRVWFANH